ncbi:DEAD/DEAH box helicase [Halomicrococcus gelatinilyticus]|uniref:DEAD/DEAH box helicase n=1 Tax=Halomicrococcus gelatinilyticus TaxID=1702103 RepID=UPI002E12F3B7
MAATDAETDYVDHPLLVPEFIERRLYQIQLAGTARNEHTLVCLPTGLGKTTVSLLVTAERLNEVGGKSLLLAPTKPLVNQHAEFYREALAIPDEDVVVFTGEVRPEERSELWRDAQVVIATPQVVENDLVGGRVDLGPVTHVTFDECHRATGDYAYNYIAERYHADAEAPLVTGMSASPGGDEESILEVCENLGIREVEVMTEEDSDVAEYTHDTDVEWVRVELPDEVVEIRDALNEVISDRLERLKELGVVNTTRPDISQKDLNAVRGELQKLIDNDQSEGYKGMSAHAEVMKLRRAVELVETQSVESLRRYFERQRNAARSSGASKASQRFVSEPKVQEAMRKAEAYDERHPKFRKAHANVAQALVDGGERIIVFTESRDTAETLTEFFSEHFTAQRFVGQGDKDGSDGMTQKEQQETLDRFRAGEFEVLVSTSVAEEGLDVPEVDLVLFYEPVPTAVRSIQRKGRTGRQAQGRVVVLLAEDTRDEAYFWIAQRREDEMEEELRELKGVADEVEAELDDSQQTLGDFDDDATSEVGHGLEEYAEESQPTDADDLDGAVPTARGEDATEIVADQRELDANIARDLSARDEVDVRLETLAVGDYICSDRVAVERKSVSDFLDSLVGGDRSVFEQVGDMTRHYSRPVLVLEGEGLYEQRNVHPNAVRGALASLAVDFGVSVLRTEDEDDTADLLEVVAAREQETSDREVSVHGEKQAKTLAEQQEYVVASIADIGPVTARSLLAALGSVEAVMTASEEELLDVEGVGQVTADRIREVVASDYEG